MSRKNRFIITLQEANGGSQPFSFEITGGKAKKVVELIKDDIEKKRKIIEKSTTTLDQFFNDNNWEIYSVDIALPRWWYRNWS